MNKAFQFGWWLVIFTVFIMNLISGVLYYFFPEMNYYLLAAISEITLIFPVLLGYRYLKKAEIPVREILGFNKFSPKKLLPSSVMMLGAQPFITFITLPIQIVLIILFGAEINTNLLEPPSGVIEFILAFFALCVVAPVFEELLCRGVLISIFKKYGFYMMLFSATLVFTLLHFDARSFIQIFFLGLILTYFRISTNSVFMTIILHSLNNFIALLQLCFMDSAFINIFSAITVLFAVLVPVLVFFELRKNKISELKFKYPKTSDAGFSTALMICIILFIIFNILLIVGRVVSGEMVSELFDIFQQ